MLQHLDSDIIFENITIGEVNLSTVGIEEFRNQANQAKKLFPKRHQVITYWIVDPEKLTVHIDYYGINNP